MRALISYRARAPTRVPHVHYMCVVSPDGLQRYSAGQTALSTVANYSTHRTVLQSLDLLVQ